MSGPHWDEAIHEALSSSINRRIVDTLSRESQSWSQIQSNLGNVYGRSQLDYHLQILTEFVEFDTGNKKYCLNYRGELLVRVMNVYITHLSRTHNYSKYL
jgi:hypothetical protein